jgi:hypothetical protein
MEEALTACDARACNCFSVDIRRPPAVCRAARGRRNQVLRDRADGRGAAARSMARPGIFGWPLGALADLVIAALSILR